jgi:putative oxidoreductase
MMKGLGDKELLAGRILIGALFLFTGISKLTEWASTAGFMTAKGVPMTPTLLVAAIAVELLGALAIIAGFQVRLAAWALATYLIPTTLIFHNFWAMQGMERHENLIQFLKNMSIMGGLLVMAGAGPGKISLEHESK